MTDPKRNPAGEGGAPGDLSGLTEHHRKSITRLYTDPRMDGSRHVPDAVVALLTERGDR